MQPIRRVPTRQKGFSRFKPKDFVRFVRGSPSGSLSEILDRLNRRPEARPHRADGFRAHLEPRSPRKGGVHRANQLPGFGGGTPKEVTYLAPEPEPGTHPFGVPGLLVPGSRFRRFQVQVLMGQD